MPRANKTNTHCASSLQLAKYCDLAATLWNSSKLSAFLSCFSSAARATRKKDTRITVITWLLFINNMSTFLHRRLPFFNNCIRITALEARRRWLAPGVRWCALLSSFVAQGRHNDGALLPDSLYERIVLGHGWAKSSKKLLAHGAYARKSWET